MFGGAGGKEHLRGVEAAQTRRCNLLEYRALAKSRQGLPKNSRVKEHIHQRTALSCISIPHEGGNRSVSSAYRNHCAPGFMIYLDEMPPRGLRRVDGQGFIASTRHLRRLLLLTFKYFIWILVFEGSETATMMKYKGVRSLLLHQYRRGRTRIPVQSEFWRFIRNQPLTSSNPGLGFISPEFQAERRVLVYDKLHLSVVSRSDAPFCDSRFQMPVSNKARSMGTFLNERAFVRAG